MAPQTGYLAGTWHYGTRIEYGSGDWWRYYKTVWPDAPTFDRIWHTFDCVPADDHVILRVSARLVDENEIHIAMGHTDYEYLGETTANRIPWTETTHVELLDFWDTHVGSLTISPVWPPNRWPKIPELQL